MIYIYIYIYSRVVKYYTRNMRTLVRARTLDGKLQPHNSLIRTRGMHVHKVRLYVPRKEIVIKYVQNASTSKS